MKFKITSSFIQFIYIFCFSIVCFSSRAQTIQLFDVGLSKISVDSISIQDNDTLIYNILLNEASAFVHLSADTVDISDIELSLGSTNGASDLFNKTFHWTQEGTFADGTSYFHEKQVQRLGLGKFRYSGTYYALVRVKKNGAWSAPVSFQTNP